MTGEEGMREKERVRQLKQQLRDELRQELDGYRQVEDEELTNGSTGRFLKRAVRDICP